MFDGIFTPDEEILREQTYKVANDRYGFVIGDRDFETIQDNYREAMEQIPNNLMNEQRVSEQQIEDCLSYLESNEGHVEKVDDMVYFLDLLKLPSREASDEIFERIEDLFEECLIFSREDLIDFFPGLHDTSAEYFVDKLVEYDIIRYLHEEEILTVGDYMEGRTSVRFSDVLRSASRNGMIFRYELNELTCVEITDGLIDYLEEENLLIRIDDDGRFLISSAIGDFAADVSQQIAAEIKMDLQDNDFVMSEESFDETVRESLIDNLQLDDNFPDVEETIYREVRLELMSRLGLEYRETEEDETEVVAN
jgi:hypothetical protein